VIWLPCAQGIYVDTDGSLLNPFTLPSLVGARVGNNTWHSGVGNDGFDPSKCLHTSKMAPMGTMPVPPGNGVVCLGGMTFRRLLVRRDGCVWGAPMAVRLTPSLTSIP
jgi:hypothetical protein